MMKKLIAIAVLVAFAGTAGTAFAANVYVTKNGKKYHTENCPLIQKKETTMMDDAKAIEAGYAPCGKCQKELTVQKAKKEAKK